MDIHIHLNFCFANKEQGGTTGGIQSEVMLSQVADERMAYARTHLSYSSQSNYQTAVRSFRHYLGQDMRLADIDRDIIVGFERWLRQKGICPNTVSCYMRSLRAILASHDRRMYSVFDSVFTGREKTTKRALPMQAFLELRRLQLPSGSFLELSRDVFLFSFYAMGMPFVDVAHLRWQQIETDHFVYFRQKTGQRVSVAIEPPMQQIIDRHGGDGEFVFPLLHQGSDAEYQHVLGRYNRNLRRLGEAIGTTAALTSYVARHSWATMAYQQDVALPVISKALGHANPHTTLTYLRETDDMQLAKANHALLHSFL